MRVNDISEYGRDDMTVENPGIIPNAPRVGSLYRSIEGVSYSDWPSESLTPRYSWQTGAVVFIYDIRKFISKDGDNRTIYKVYFLYGEKMHIHLFQDSFRIWPIHWERIL